jgi:hypothetical protein
VDETTAFLLGLSIAVQLIPIMLWFLRENPSPARVVLPAYLLPTGRDRVGTRFRYCVVATGPQRGQVRR